VLLGLALACGPERDPLEEIRELQQAGRFAATVEPLRTLLDEDPASAEGQLLLGLALLRTGEAGMAVWPLRRAAETPEHAVEASLLLAQAMLRNGATTGGERAQACSGIGATETTCFGARDREHAGGAGECACWRRWQ
jgi:Flp pilus assembly protein TadD